MIAIRIKGRLWATTIGNKILVKIQNWALNNEHPQSELHSTIAYNSELQIQSIAEANI